MRKFQWQRPTANELWRMGLLRKVYFSIRVRTFAVESMTSGPWMCRTCGYNTHYCWRYCAANGYTKCTKDGSCVQGMDAEFPCQKQWNLIGGENEGGCGWLLLAIFAEMNLWRGTATYSMSSMCIIITISCSSTNKYAQQRQWQPVIQSNYSMECGRTTLSAVHSGFEWQMSLHVCNFNLLRVVRLT